MRLGLERYLGVGMGGGGGDVGRGGREEEFGKTPLGL